MLNVEKPSIVLGVALAFWCLSPTDAVAQFQFGLGLDRLAGDNVYVFGGGRRMLL